MKSLPDCSVACCTCCSQGITDEQDHFEVVTTTRARSVLIKSGSSANVTTMQALLDCLKKGGGPDVSPKAEQNKAFFDQLDFLFPELHIYRVGKIQTSPGCEDIEGSPTEYYRTASAMIALICCYAEIQGDSLGIDCVSKGARGPMSMDKIPGKFINIGNKPKDYHAFCVRFAEHMIDEDDWWAMMVFLAIHDVGKSDAFRNAVNAMLPEAQRTDDHDAVLAAALANYELKEQYLPSLLTLSPKRQEMLLTGFQTNFQLPQLGQGEIAVINLLGLTALPPSSLADGTLRNYMYHSIFDIAGTSANENFIFPLALVPVYIGFSTAMDELICTLAKSDRPDPHTLYFDFLYGGFQKAYPEFEADIFHPMCESKLFREETGLVVLRILALTRNTYKNPQNVLELCLKHQPFQSLVHEMSGKPNPPGPQIMLYYGPDMLRMGLGEDLEDASGENMEAALYAISDLYLLARKELGAIKTGGYQYQLNVCNIVTEIKKAGKAWSGGSQLQHVCNSAFIESNCMKTEGMVILYDANGDTVC